METLWTLTGAVRNVKPNATPTLAAQLLNKHIQNIIKKRSWSDLYRIGALVFPNQYSTGTIANAQGSNLVTGTATAWPVNDAINGVLAQPITDTPGVCDIYPDAITLAALKQGDYLVLDMEITASTEVVIVTHVAADHFQAFCKYQHQVGHTIQKSSLANQQITMLNNQVATVTAVFSPTSLQMDQPYGGVAMVGGTYFICLRYVRISNTAYRLLDALDPVAGVQIGTTKTFEWLNRQDPQRTTIGINPLELVSMAPNPGGVMQWELWPAQQTAYIIPVFYIDGWPKLKADNDLSPYFINDEIFIALAQADALMTKNIPREGKQDPYYDPNASAIFRQQGMALLEEAIQQDEGRILTGIQMWQDQLQGAGCNTPYMSSHLDTWVDGSSIG
jgi:hypothetical protein